MLKAYKYRIYPSDAQKHHFVQAMGCVRYIYNKGLEIKIKCYEQTGETLSYFCLANGFLLEEKKTNEWLMVPNAQSLQMALRNLDNAFTRFFRKQSKFPTFKKKNGRGSIQYPQKVSVDFKRSKVKLPKVGEVFCVFDRKFDGKIKTCTVSKTPTGKFFISILVDNDQTLPSKVPIILDGAIGIDLGLTHFAILSDGTKVPNPRFLSKLLDRLNVLQRRASRKVKGSNNRRKANLKVARLYETISNQRSDFLHKLSTKLIRENQTIILEDLNVAGMLRNHCLAQNISDVSWGEFVRLLTYKAEWYGKNLIKIGRFDPSSKLCSCCGWKNPNLTLDVRSWTCQECHTQHDRDVNAAINIKKFGLIRSNTGQELPEALAEISSSTPKQKAKGKTDRRRKKSSAKYR
jgi:putative transposase